MPHENDLGREASLLWPHDLIVPSSRASMALDDRKRQHKMLQLQGLF